MSSKQIQCRMHKNIENRKIKGKKIQTVNITNFGKYDILEYKLKNCKFLKFQSTIYWNIKTYF